MPTHAVMAAPRIDRRRAVWVLIAALLWLVPAVACAEPFRITHTVDRSGGGPVRVNGRVINEGPVDVFDVYVTAEALDASGKVLGRGIAFVSQMIPSRGAMPFSISIPAATNAANFRVGVSSFRHGVGLQAG